MIKKFILLILVTSLILTPLLSCASDSNNNQNTVREDTENAEDNQLTEPEEIAEEHITPDLPDIDFDGYEFRILNTRNGEIPWLLTTLIVDEESGEALNDAIFRRNRIAEEKYGFNLVQIDASGPDDVLSRARRSIQSGSDDFDLAMTTPDSALSLAQISLLESIDNIPYIDLSKPYWDQDMNRDFSIGNRVFFTSGDFSFNQYSATTSILFNKKMHADLGLEDPYRFVREGKWTIEKFGEMAKHSLIDLNGDGAIDQHDQWGYMSFSHVYTLAIMCGLGAKYIQKDDNDIPYLSMNTEEFVNRFHAAFDVLNEGWLFDGNQWGIGRPEDMFLESRALFWTELMNWANILRSMEHDFGILPMPKLNEQQEHYIATTGRPHVMCIPITTSNLERTGIILEALCAESRKSTKSAYYDTMLKSIVIGRDDESGEMLDIIFENKVYEIGRLFWESNIAGPIASAMANGNRDIVSIIERNEVRAATAIEKAVEAFLGE